MAARGQSLAERFARWQVLVSNLKQTDGLAHIADKQQKLEELLGEARTLENQKDEMRSQLRVINARLRVLAKDGDVLRSRIGSNLHGEYGAFNESLIRFGFEPRRVPRRGAKQDVKEKKPEAQAAQEAKAPAGDATPAGTEA